MKKIKINYCGFWKSLNKTDNFLYNILKDRYEIEISDNPDYLFVSPLGKAYEFLKYDCIRIMYSGEELTPDFSFVDYAIGFDYLSFADRYYRYPYCFIGSKPWQSEIITEEQAKGILKSKDLFCNLIYNEDSIGKMRSKLFEALKQYKKFESYGKFMNSVGGKGITYKEKDQILRRSKFTLAIEGCSFTGGTTEKLTAPFENHSIPIYWGNPIVGDEFNIQSFVWVSSEDEIDIAIEKIKEIDNSDELYIQMLMARPLYHEEYSINIFNGLKEFLYHIFDQDIDQAKRRVDSLASRNNETAILNGMFYEHQRFVPHPYKRKGL